MRLDLGEATLRTGAVLEFGKSFEALTFHSFLKISSYRCCLADVPGFTSKHLAPGQPPPHGASPGLWTQQRLPRQPA